MASGLMFKILIQVELASGMGQSCWAQPLNLWDLTITPSGVRIEQNCRTLIWYIWTVGELVVLRKKTPHILCQQCSE